MLFPIVPLALALAVQPPDSEPPYASEALRALVGAAAETNIRVPAGLKSYTATVETEAALITADPRAREQSIQVEQVALAVSWDRSGQVAQRVIGLRSHASVFTAVSALSVTSWLVPVLYGNRFSLFFGPQGKNARRAADTASAARRVDAVHPLAADRDEVYRYSGGDTVAVVRPGTRSIPVVRVRVEPLGRPAVRTTVLRGELLLDAATHQLIAMRGEMLEIGGSASLLERAGDRLIQAFAYIDLQSREVEGRYWLPATQRIEFQIGSPLTGDARAAWRFQSRFDDLEVALTDSLIAATVPDTLVAAPRRLAIADDAALASYDAWRWALGEGTANLRIDDFDDIAGEGFAHRGSRALRVTAGVHARRLDEVFRFNRIEGLFTGIGMRARAVKGEHSLAAGGSIGRAWQEGVVRGGVFTELDAPSWRLSAGAERRLEVANRFGEARLEGSAATFAALLGSDDLDYLDRRHLVVNLERELLSGSARVRADAAVASDRDVATSARRGLFRVDSAFRDNRPVDEGSYARVGFSVVVHPDVSVEFARPGWTAGLRVEQAASTLSWTHVEVGGGIRRIMGRFTTTGRLDAGLVESRRVPMQQLFAIGGAADVPGFEYKEFGGDRAVVARGTVRYALPLLEGPARLPFFRGARGRIPPIAPTLAVGLRGIWTDASSDATLGALGRLGIRPGTTTLLSRPTDGMPAAASAGVLLFGGGLFIGVSRRLDTQARWSLTFSPGLAL